MSKPAARERRDRTVGYIQFQPEFGEVKKNLDKAEEFIRSVPDADLLVLPELITTGYEFLDRDEVARYAEPFNGGPTARRMAKLAREFKTTLVIGFPEKDTRHNRLFNSCILVTPDGMAHVYRKIHLFDREKELFDRAHNQPPVIVTPAGRIGLMICFDWLFPETARLLALSGAEIIAHPSDLVLKFCQRAMFARSVENGVFTITCNRIGREDRVGRTLMFTGASQILSPRGDLLASAPEDQEHVGLATIDLNAADDKMITPHNHRINDRRTDLYRPLLSS
ncbi:MAG: (R)-stereoselective amidase [Calditrichaeota bacterium]|nr:(R)-stereoselective amidase [Calditrichota bacterium]